MLAYFFNRGLVVVINSDDAKGNEERAIAIAVERFKAASIADDPTVSGVATLPADGVVMMWNDPPQSLEWKGDGPDEDAAVHRIVDDKIEELSSEFREELDRRISIVEERIDGMEAQ